MEFGVLGPLEVFDAGRTVDIGGPRHRKLLAALVLRRNQVVLREQLVAVCWGDEPPTSATSLVHVRVSELRKALGRACTGPSPIRTVSGGYRLEVEATDVDVARFEVQTESGRRALANAHHVAALDTLRAALALWRGAPYPEVEQEPQAQAEVARLEALRVEAEDDLLAARLALGEHASVAAELQALLVQTPWAERRWTLLMLAHYRCGRQAEALSAFSSARERLVDDLGVEPGAELRAMHQAVLNQDPSISTPRSGPDVHAEPDPGPTLPARFTSFVGRRSELATAERLLKAERLISMVGPGGAGKTSLALEAAASVLGTYTGGVHVVELADIRDPQLVATAVAARLGLADRGGADLTGRIGGRLGDQTSLLVLDNCEQVLDGVVDVVDRLLRERPTLTVLTTSRERLGLPGERVVQIAGLELPGEGRDMLPQEVGRADAARLLVERATAVRADFRLDGETAPHVARICRRLDGLPLSLELAAAAVGALDIAEIARRLLDRLDLGGVRSGQGLRHQSLQSVVDWSYELLSDQERRVFEQVSVFNGSFSLASAEQICLSSLGPSSVATLLWRLVDTSLLSSETSDAGRRYRLLESIKEFALGRLARRGDLAASRARHAEHFLRLAETADAALRGPSRRYWAAELEREHGNLLAAMEWFIENDRTESVTRLVGSIYAFWDPAGAYEEERRWLTRALASPEGAAPGPRVRALMGSATIAVMHGDLRTAETLSAEVVELARSHSDYEGLAHSLQFRGLAAVFASDLRSADGLFAESLEAARFAGLTWLEAWAYEFQAAVALARGSYEETVRLARRGVELSRSDGDPECTAWALVTVAIAEVEAGRARFAIPPLHESLGCFHELGVSWGLSLAILACAQIAGSNGEHESAAAFLSASERLRALSRAGTLPSLRQSFENRRSACVEALGPDAFGSAWTAGEGESVDQTLARATKLLAGVR